MKRLFLVAILAIACAPAQTPQKHGVEIARSGSAKARVIVQTIGTAIKETGPAETVKTFGEVYAFQPAVFAVTRDQPTQIVFWNLQPDDEHDFMLTDPQNKVLVQTKLPPLSKTSFVMSFHDSGVYPYYCTVHQPAMSGQIVVQPAGGKSHS
ncbi:MAG TPA: hypothetical protein VLU46_11980 [Thermoanaerobaculia bacterium]|nr:hypothetical protein [Thermoanaerobaculia bacterium]